MTSKWKLQKYSTVVPTLNDYWQLLLLSTSLNMNDTHWRNLAHGNGTEKPSPGMNAPATFSQLNSIQSTTQRH